MDDSSVVDNGGVTSSDFDRLLCFIKAFVLNTPYKNPKHKDDPYKVQGLMHKLANHDVYISCELAESVIAISQEPSWLKAIVPVLLTNVMYVQYIDGVAPCEQTIEHHSWLPLLQHNTTNAFRSTLKENARAASTVKWFAVSTLLSLEHIRQLCQLREISSSPVGYLAPSAHHIAGRVQDWMVEELPVTLQGRDLGEYIKWILTDRLGYSDATAIGLMSPMAMSSIAPSPSDYAQAVSRIKRTQPNVQQVQKVVTHTIAGPSGLRGQSSSNFTFVIDSLGGEQYKIGNVSMAALDSVKRQEEPRGKYTSVPGHDTVNPWKNQGKRGRVK